MQTLKLTIEDWQTKYQPLLVNGLTDGPLYVRLKVKELPTLKVEVAFRPIIDRISDAGLVVGGKLAVFPVAGSLKAEPSSESTMVKWLLSAYPEIKWPKVSEERVGAMIMGLVNAPYTMGREFVKQFDVAACAEGLLALIERELGETVDDREQAKTAIIDAFNWQIPLVFKDLKHPGAEVEEPTLNVVDLFSKKTLSAPEDPDTLN